MRKFAILIAVSVSLAACASTSEPGWTGAGAEPFGQAQADCQQRTQSQEGAAFDACMAEKGWRRGG